MYTAGYPFRVTLPIYFCVSYMIIRFLAAPEPARIIMFNPHIFYFILIVYISQLHAYLHHDHFPANFLFGSASSSHQIEGAWLTDGKTPNIWDNMTHSHPELIYDRSNANVACDSYHHVAQDVRLLHEAGVDYYRFSISWARIMPYRNSSIEKRPNKAGLSYYDRLIDELLSHGIAPMVTMYHWDLPQWLQDLGGWLNTEEVLWHFERYADVLFERYGSRVPTWITFNEPKLFCSYGYDKGTWAPLVRLPGIGEYQCAKSVLLANAAVYELYARKYRLQYGGKGRVGITLNAAFWWPKDARNSAHVAAAERAMQFYMGLYMHPIFQGGFPPIVQRTVAKRSRREGRRKSRLPRLTLKERDWIRGKADFVGVNYYTSFLATPVSGARSLDDNEVLDGVDNQWPQAKSQWLRSVPDGLRQTLK